MSNDVHRRRWFGAFRPYLELTYLCGLFQNALQEHKKASFYYFDRDEHGEKVYRKNKKRYIVDPMALVFNDDNYYLMCFSSKYDGICN